MGRPTSLRAAVVGGTGYIGMQCVSLLAGHPDVHLVSVTARSAAGQRYDDVVRGSNVGLMVSEDLAGDDLDVVFAALPHTLAASRTREWLSAGAVVIDMSADFRLVDSETFERWYGVSHPAPELCAGAVYGLVELARAALADTQLVAVPGCYPTAALLGALPLLGAGLVEPRLIVDAKSGVSGAGRSPSATTHFGEANESVRAYGVGGHRHSAEMSSRLDAAAGEPVGLVFVPHLVPMTRGLLATLYLRPRAGRAVEDVASLLSRWCAAEPFLRYDEQPPPTKSVLGSNVAAINCTGQDGTAVVTVAIDNLLKGAAGQAVQAMNVRFGLAETAGLPLSSAWP